MLSQTFRIWGEMLHVGHISYVTMNCGKHQWVPFLNISLRPRWEKTLPEKYFPYLKIFLKSLLSNVAFLTFRAI